IEGSHHGISKALLIRLRQSKIEGLQRRNRGAGQRWAYEGAGQRAEGEPHTKKGFRIGVLAAEQDLSACLQRVDSLDPGYGFIDVNAARDVLVRQKAVAIEEAEACYLQRWAKGIVGGSTRVVVTELSAGLLNQRG